MAKVSRCKTSKGCSRTRWKEGHCRKCFTKEQVVTATPAPTKKKKKKKKIYETGVGTDMADEYFHLHFSSEDDEVRKILSDTKASALDMYTSLCTPPPGRCPSRRLFRPNNKKDSAAFRSISTKIVEAMKKSGKFASLFRAFKAPAFLDDSFIVAYPQSYPVACPTLHRDNLEKFVYSVFFLLTPMTSENGTVRIYLKSSKWEKDFKRNTEEVIKHNERKFGTCAESRLMLGEESDLIAFDARLLHQSMPRTILDSEERIAFSFTLYDSSRHSYPSMVL